MNCYLCGTSEDVEVDDRLGTLPVPKPMCPECWLHHPSGELVIKVKIPPPDYYTMDWKNDDGFNKTGPFEQAIPIEAPDEEETR